MAEVTKLDPYKTINDKISGDIDDSLNKVIQRITSRSSDKWRELALKMIDPSKVTEITGKFQSTYDRYCEVFKVWLDTAAGKRTWKQLTEILREVDVFQSVAAEIERALPSSTEPSRSELRPTASTSTGVTITDNLTTKSINSTVACDNNEQHKWKKLYSFDDFDDIDAEFTNMVKKVQKAFKKNNVDVSELITSLRNSMAAKYRSIPLFDPDIFDKITSIDKLFQILSGYWHLLDYDVLLHLLRVADCQEAKRICDDFFDSFDSSVIQDHFDHLICNFQEFNQKSNTQGIWFNQESDIPGTHIVRVKITLDKSTKIEKKQVKEILSEKYHLKKYALVCKGIKHGCVEIIYQVSLSVKIYMLQYSLSELDISQLKDHMITDILMDDDDDVNLMIPSAFSKQIQKILTSKLVTSLNPKDQEATLQTLRKIFDNIDHYPNDEKYRKLKLANQTFNSKVWQYPAGKELMKMSGWIVEDEHVRLQDDSHVHIIVESLNQLCALPTDQFTLIMDAAINGDMSIIEKKLNRHNVSSASIIYFQDGSSISLLKVAIATQNMDLINLLKTYFTIDIYVPSEHVFITMLDHAPEGFIIDVLKVCDAKNSFTFTSDGFTMLHLAVFYNCLKVVCYLITNVNVNDATNEYKYTPLHCANLSDHKEIANWLSQNGADVTARDYRGCTPLDYINGDPKFIEVSQYIQNKRRIHLKPFSAERLRFLELINTGVDDETAVSITMASIKEKEITQGHDHQAAIKKELPKYINISSKYNKSFLSGIALS